MLNMAVLVCHVETEIWAGKTCLQVTNDVFGENSFKLVRITNQLL